MAYYRQTVAALEGARRYERFGGLYSPAVLARADLAVCHAELGTFPEGRAVGDDGLRIAEAIDSPWSLMLASWGRGLLSLVQGDLHGALPLLERAVGLCQETDLPLYFPWVAAALGAAYTLAGRVAEAVPLLTRAVEQSPCPGGARHGSALSPRPERGAAAGRPPAGGARPRRAGAGARPCAPGTGPSRPMPYASSATLRRGASPRSAIRPASYYRQALALADELGMRPLQAHCHRGLGTLYGTLGQQEPARSELSTAIEMYRVMGMTFWLPQAEAALAQVEGR